MPEIIDIGAHDEHIVRQVICLMCYKRWTAIYPVGTQLVMLHCSGCGNDGFVIATGD